MTSILPLGVEIALYLAFGLFCIGILAGAFSTIYSLIIKRNVKSILTIVLGLAVIGPCLALFFNPNKDLIATCLIITCSLILIAIISIVFSTILNFVKK